MIPLRINDQRYKNEKVILIVLLVLEILTTSILLFLYYNLTYDYFNFINNLFEDTMLVYGILVSIILLINIISLILFIKWFRRAYYNTHLLNHDCRFEDERAMNSWFIPMYNLIVPYLIMKEMFEKNSSLLKLPLKNAVFYLINAWWFLWLIAIFLKLNYYAFIFTFGLYEDFWGLLKRELVFHFIQIPLCVLTILVMKKYALIEDELQRKFGLIYF